ncbi:MAG: DNA-directed RNA polymerase subunit beta' [Chloroflexi bacterium]|nr:DNA-directed RNA polymerase subunit beta' [Chloroflexota bacterium]
MVSGTGEFNAIRISLASPEQIKAWSYGEVTKPETINYRTLRPEKDGLFCERIFGPTKDWECFCGRYKRIRYRGVICDRCGVEVTRAKVRRERMGHIDLAAPVAHIWFSKGTPSRMGLLLDLSPRNLDRVLYFAQYLITSIDEEARQRALGQFRELLTRKVAIPESRDDDSSSGSLESGHQIAENEPSSTANSLEGKRSELEEIQQKIDELEDLRLLQLLPESRYRELRDNYGEVFQAGMGAEAVVEVLRSIDLELLREKLQQEVISTSGQRHKKAIKRLRLVEAFRKSGNKAEWMILTKLPVLPPELRPMVQLDGGRFAISDLNDLYRRVINRNNRLKRLIELHAPEIILRNEKRMLQEAVDALVDNGRRGRAIPGSHNHKLKSLSDLLRGKQGRYRQNLLGKRVDYSGRSVIVVGPTLKLHECGLPKRMALELFKPFVMNQLFLKGHSHSIRSAKRMVEQARPEVWDILEEVIMGRPVLLNRAPTLHRLGIQAFQPVLVEGSAIQLHPLVCTAFNADFDGDQMAVHVPLSREAVLEAKKVLLSPNNMLSPSSGDPTVSPTLDIVLGCFYLTTLKPNAIGTGKRFMNFEDALLAYDLGQIGLRAEILVRDAAAVDGWLKTSVGRSLFNAVLPLELRYQNEVMDKKALKKLVAQCHRMQGSEATANVLDAIKELGFRYATQAGITIAINDVEVPQKKKGIIEEADQSITQLEEQYQTGLISEDERYRNAVDIWTKASDSITNIIEENLQSYGGIYLMAMSGAKGNIAQIKQMAGMRGLMSDPKGRIIELPIRSSFREGLTVLEYFISTHGARKGLADTALRTADSGYLTRRLVDVAQEVITLTGDCGTESGIWVEDQPEKSLLPSFGERVLGRLAAAPIADPSTGEILADRNQEINEELVAKLAESRVKRAYVRSPLGCQAARGVCQYCYGRSPATGRLVMLGEAVGIIAAQSIGEPGTQLTMRTFHTGGVAGVSDITSGLPRVEELFEARVPRGQAILAEIDGRVAISDVPEGRVVKVVNTEEFTDSYAMPKGYRLMVGNGDLINAGVPLAIPKVSPKAKKNAEETGMDMQPEPLLARFSGLVHLDGDMVTISWTENEEREYLVPLSSHIIVQEGGEVTSGQPLTSGPKNPQDILRIQGREEVQRYLAEEVQKVYRSQGVSIHDKHIEVVMRQMLCKVRVDSPGDTELLPGELIERSAFEETNARVLAEGGEPSTASPVLLGVTRASLETDSFLAAASFQETTRVLTEAAVQGRIDYLKGLKENVIIGRLIPARIDLSEEGRQRLGLDQLRRQAIGVLTGPTEAPPHIDMDDTYEELLPTKASGNDV